MNLVTGATGIIGSHVLLHLLRRNEPVKAGRQRGSDIEKTRRLFMYYSDNDAGLFDRITWVDLDIRDIYSVESALEGVTNVYHCAGLVSFSRKQRKELFEINEKGTANMVNACLNRGIDALCHVSTIGTINNIDHTSPLDESVFWKTSGRESDYALSKYNAEREVWRGMEEGLNAVIVNPGVVLSPGFWGQSSARIFGNCHKGSLFYTPGTAGYVAAGDVAEVMVSLVQKRLFGNRYILVEGNYSFREIFNRVHGYFQKSSPRLKAGRWLLRVARRLEAALVFFTGREPLLSRGLINAAFNTQTFSSDKVKKALGFEFKPVLPLLGFICQHYVSDHSKPQASV